MPQTSHVACFGEGLIALIPPVAGPLEASRTFHRSLAGAEWNTAIALSSAGASASVLSRVGDDGFGRFLIAELEHHGVDTSAIEIDPQAQTGLYVKELLPLGNGEVEGTMHYYRAESAASALSPDYLRTPAAARALRSADIVHTSGITPAISPSARAAQDALFDQRHADRLISFDVNWRPTLWRGRTDEGRELLTRYARAADFVFCTQPDAIAVFGTDDPRQLRSLLPEPGYLVLTNPTGATAFHDDDVIESSALDVPVVETIGAGDAFAAGFLAGMLAGLSLPGCLARAHRIATRALRTTRDHVD